MAYKEIGNVTLDKDGLGNTILVPTTKYDGELKLDDISGISKVLDNFLLDQQNNMLAFHIIIDNSIVDSIEISKEKRKDKLCILFDLTDTELKIIKSIINSLNLKNVIYKKSSVSFLRATKDNPGETVPFYSVYFDTNIDKTALLISKIVTDFFGAGYGNITEEITFVNYNKNVRVKYFLDNLADELLDDDSSGCMVIFLLLSSSFFTMLFLILK